MTSTAEVVEEQEVARAEPARLAVGCLEFDLALADHAELAVRSGMEISEPVLGPAEEDDSGGWERIGDCDWRSGRRERGEFEFHVHVLEVRLSVVAVVDANIAQRLRSAHARHDTHAWRQVQPAAPSEAVAVAARQDASARVYRGYWLCSNA